MVECQEQVNLARLAAKRSSCFLGKGYDYDKLMMIHQNESEVYQFAENDC